MKKIILFSITFLISLSSSAQVATFAEVNAKNGLRMREKPDAASDIITALSYKNTITVKKSSN